MEQLKDKDEPMDLGRAKAICEAAQVLVDSAKVEVQLIGQGLISAWPEYLGDQNAGNPGVSR
jgi:hypothetical protein